VCAVEIAPTREYGSHWKTCEVGAGSGIATLAIVVLGRIVILASGLAQSGGIGGRRRMEA